MAEAGSFRRFGDRSRFALELLVDAVQPSDAVPHDSVGTWGAWRLFIAEVNLCRLQLETDDGIADLSEVRWFLAPLLRWLVASWMPLIHEAHLPSQSGWGDRRPRWARLAYLAMLERSGDDIERFRPWQEWAARHALRFAAEGGIVPDVFFQRVGDEIEVSWGDRVQPGGEGAAFLVEDGVARAHVDDVAAALSQAIEWLLRQDTIATASWSGDLSEGWVSLARRQSDLEPLHWYLDSQPDAGPLSRMFLAGLEEIGKPPPPIAGRWVGTLSPEVAMFGDLTPQVSPEAATRLLKAYYGASSDQPESQSLATLVSDEPAWTTTSPWENGYALALDVLDEVDPRPSDARTDLDVLLERLEIAVREVPLGRRGPRGAAFAGTGLQPTILLNPDHPMNARFGRRFTLAHELCHILFDRSRARPLAHSSTPWASPSIEQRANAFAAMLLMPPSRAKRPVADSLADLRRGIATLAETLEVSRGALLHHLENLGQIDADERDGMSTATNPT